MHRIRLASPADAALLLALQHRLDVQSPFMLLEPGEREPAPDRLRERLAAQGGAGSFDLVAEHGDGGDDDEPLDARDAGAAGDLVGYVTVGVVPFARARHTGHVVIGVDAAAAGRGVGRALLAAAERQASDRGLLRLELTVMTDNLRAVGLYLRSGFEVEGLRRRALVRGGVAVDEYYMGKLLRRRARPALKRAENIPSGSPPIP